MSLTLLCSGSPNPHSAPRHWPSASAAALLVWPLLTVQASPAQPLPDSEVAALVRTAQLADWLGEPVTLDQGLCVQARLRGRWPTADGGPATEHQWEALRSAVDACHLSAGTNGQPRDGDRGVVTDGRAQFLVLVARLQASRQALDSCRQLPGEDVERLACASRVVGRTLNPQEQRWLLAARGRP